MEEFDKIACMDDAAVRTEISGSVTYHPAGQEDPRKFLGTDTYPGIGLGILEQDIVPGLELLDQVVLQKKGVRLRLDHGIFRIRNLRDHHRSLPRQPLGRHEILRHPLVQVLCLTHINHIPLGVIIPVDTWGMWKKLYLIS